VQRTVAVQGAPREAHDLILEKPKRRGPKPRTRLRRSGPVARKRRVSRAKKSKTGAMERQAWALASKLCRHRARYSCERCTAPGWEIAPEVGVQLSAAHVISRRYEATKYLLLNLFSLCDECHRYLKDAPPGKESRMKQFFIEKRGAEDFARLERDALAGGKFSPEKLLGLQWAADRHGLTVVNSQV
jgi:5-methylcytosine-specific restriction endonuclease McrA